jgi:hypothetical protein
VRALARARQNTLAQCRRVPSRAWPPPRDVQRGLSRPVIGVKLIGDGISALA